MKECNVAATIVLLLALSLVVTLSVGLGLTLANENNGNSGLPELQKPTPASLHYAAEANVAQATMKADIAKLLNVPSGAELSIIGTADLETSGKYVFICTWSGGETKEVEVFVYDNTFSYVVDNREIVDGTVSMYYEDALATNDFTKGITVKDSLGNVIQAVKSSDSMSFNNKVGIYTVSYTATDAAGQVFSFTLNYDVTYPFSFIIETPNVVVPASQKTVRIDVDFDGAPLDQINLWVEDSAGKKIAGLYSTITDKDDEGNPLDGYQIILRSYYYAKFAGQTIELSICSDYGKATFYVTVLDE